MFDQYEQMKALGGEIGTIYNVKTTTTRSILSISLPGGEIVFPAYMPKARLERSEEQGAVETGTRNSRNTNDSALTNGPNKSDPSDPSC